MKRLLKRPEKDPRVTVGYMSGKNYLLLFSALGAINGVHVAIYLMLARKGLLELRPMGIVNLLMITMMFSAAILLVGIGTVRYISWESHMRHLSEAARKIAAGDFSIRIDPIRRDGKKDFMEVMFEDFNTMAEKLATIETLKTDFIANVSHEIKTPLSVIQGYAAALQSESLTADERREYAGNIIEATKKLTGLVTNILKLNRLENQGIIPGAIPYNLSEQLRRCAVAFEEFWEQKNISFDVDLEEATVCYDENMMEIVWNNLFSNAIKFTNTGGGISVRLKTENLPSERWAVVSVSDTGCGMDESTQKRIFDKFYQGDTSHTLEGNGLGLALVKKTVEILGGSVTVESSPGKGSVFTVYLKI
ncbi:MAG: HAMP domain-containing histidine kinase [Treponema sp.]|jgi:signal transduction histidine kinase|nr:HAMP domain-containing histidine kinase [Treponema sp.]